MLGEWGIAKVGVLESSYISCGDSFNLEASLKQSPFEGEDEIFRALFSDV